MSHAQHANAASSVRIALKACNGCYVSARDDGRAPLQATASSVGTWETFEMLREGDLCVAFKAANGRYVSAGADGKRPLVADRGEVGEGERFQLAPIKGDRVAIVACDGSYVSAGENGSLPLRANGRTVGNGETFVVGSAGDADEARPKPHVASARSGEAVRAPAGTSLPAFTVCFAGTACTRDEGEVSRPDSNKTMYCDETGYIPVRIHWEIAGDLRATRPSVTVRGVGENDWAVPRNDSEPLVFNGPLSADDTLLSYVRSYSGGDQFSKVTQLDGWSAPALALHGANLAAASGARQFNFVGHSRGAVAGIMAAWFLYAYGSKEVRETPVRIFAIDPVPGTGVWYSILTQLPPNVAHYVGVYSWDQCVQPRDAPFQALVPRPNGLMMGTDNHIELTYYWWWPWDRWKYLADDSQKQDPLQPANVRQPTGYELFACRGRHSTIAGNATADGAYDPKNVSADVKPAPQLIYRMARAYLTQWGVQFPNRSAVEPSAMTLRRDINRNHRHFDAMGGGATRTSVLPDRPYVRRVSSIYGRNPFNTYFMDDVVGDPPYTMAYPVTNERRNAGWVKWRFL
jgi:hypothetical protein